MGPRMGSAAVALAMSLGTALALVPTATAGATPCASEFSTLEGATANATYTSKRAWMDEQGLLGKIADAEKKVQRGKLARGGRCPPA